MKIGAKAQMQRTGVHRTELDPHASPPCPSDGGARCGPPQLLTVRSSPTRPKGQGANPDRLLKRCQIYGPGDGSGLDFSAWNGTAARPPTRWDGKIVGRALV